MADPRQSRFGQFVAWDELPVLLTFVHFVACLLLACIIDFLFYRGADVLLPPHVVVIALAGCLPAPLWACLWTFLLRRAVRPRKYAPDACQSCGYNLTGNLSGICPECGVAPADAQRSPASDAPASRHPADNEPSSPEDQ